MLLLENSGVSGELMYFAGVLRGKLRQNSATKRHRPALHIANRKQHAAPEAIVMPRPILPANNQPHGFQRLRRDVARQRLLDQPIPTVRRETPIETG